MAKYNVDLYISGRKYFDNVEANSEEEAIEKCKVGEVPMALDETYYSDEDAWEVY